MSDIDIPTNYTFNLNTVDCFDFCVRVTEIPTIKLDTIKTDSKIDAKTDSKIDAKTDSKLDAKTDSIIRIKELPVIRLKMGMDPTRIHAPLNYTFGVAVLGMQLLSFDICGEGMVIIEDYKPHKTEECA